jgi:hypothetical protein
MVESNNFGADTDAVGSQKPWQYGHWTVHGKIRFSTCTANSDVSTRESEALSQHCPIFCVSDELVLNLQSSIELYHGKVQKIVQRSGQIKIMQCGTIFRHNGKKK